MKVSKRIWFFLSTIGALIVALGCIGATATGTPQDKQTPDEIQFLRRPNQGGGSMTAIGGGKLTLVNGCLRIIGESESIGEAIGWPYDFSFRRKNGHIEILNGQNQVVARVGDEITVGGGETPFWYEGQPNHCAGPYWAADSDVTVIKP